MTKRDTNTKNVGMMKPTPRMSRQFMPSGRRNKAKLATKPKRHQAPSVLLRGDLGDVERVDGEAQADAVADKHAPEHDHGVVIRSNGDGGSQNEDEAGEREGLPPAHAVGDLRGTQGSCDAHEGQDAHEGGLLPDRPAQLVRHEAGDPSHTALVKAQVARVEAGDRSGLEDLAARSTRRTRRITLSGLGLRSLAIRRGCELAPAIEDHRAGVEQKL
eukprot:scaffold3453_cov253-Pinguiococcus_pyrenoidosus.AAC.3